MKSCLKGVAPEWYTLEDDQGADEPAQFYIEPLNGFGATDISMMRIAAQQADKSPAEAAVLGSELLRRAFQLGVRNWRNIADPDQPDQPLAFSKKAMERMRAAWIIEVGARVLAVSHLSPAEEKNSDSPSSSPAS